MERRGEERVQATFGWVRLLPVIIGLVLFGGWCQDGVGGCCRHSSCGRLLCVLDVCSLVKRDDVYSWRSAWNGVIFSRNMSMV